MSKQPEALRLAELMQDKPDSDGHCKEAAAELRRLHALLAAPQAAPASEWVTVPRELTSHMEAAVNKLAASEGSILLADMYKAILAAAPTQAAQESKENDFELRWDGYSVKGDLQSIEAVRSAVNCERRSALQAAQEPRRPMTQVLELIDRRMREHEQATNDPNMPEALKRRARARYGEARAIRDGIERYHGSTEEPIA